MRRRRADAGYDPRATRPLRNVRRHRRQTARLRRDTTLRRRESREHSCGRYVSRSNQSASRAKNSAVKDWCRGHFQTFQRIPKRDLARSRGPARTGSAHAKAASRDPHRRRLHRRHLRDRLLLAKSRSRLLRSGAAYDVACAVAESTRNVATNPAEIGNAQNANPVGTPPRARLGVRCKRSAYV